MITARISERGNGFPNVGDDVYSLTDDTVYRVVTLGSIQTGAPGVANSMLATVEDTGHGLSDDDWDALSDCLIEVVR